MNTKKLLGMFAVFVNVLAVNAHAALPQPLVNELATEIQYYEKLYQEKRGQEIFDYVDKTVLETLAERAKFPQLVKITEHMMIALVQNTDNLKIKMDLANAQSDISSAGIAYAMIPYTMTIDDTPITGKMLAIKIDGKWTFSRFDENNLTATQIIRELYPSLKLAHP